MAQDLVHVQQESLPGPHGAISIRSYRPANVTPSAALVWLHGGSFISGDLDMPEADFVAHHLVARGIEVTTVDYQLSPVPPEFVEAAGGPRDGVHYPVAVEEIEHVLRVLTVRSGQSWSLGGASAGGCLAASVAVRVRDNGGQPPSSLVLAYPLLHRVLPAPAPELAALLNRSTSSPTESEIRVIAENYLGPHVSPEQSARAFAGDGPAHDLPPMVIIDSEIDVLRASSQHFAAAVIAGGGEVHYVVEPSTRHGHLNTPGPDASRSVDRIADWLLRGRTSAARSLSKDQPTA